MYRILLLLILLTPASPVFAQKVDSIYFHLYTDSLKKGQHNYINIDGKLSNGRWIPLTEKDILFSCPQASFEGNQLVIPEDFKPEKVTVKAVYRKDPSIWIERTIWIKKRPDGPLPTRDDILNGAKPKNRKN